MDDTFDRTSDQPPADAAILRTEDLIPAVQEHPGRYLPVREYASGGMGRIWLVSDTHLGRDVALKELLSAHVPESGKTRTGAPTSDMLTIPAVARFVSKPRLPANSNIPPSCPSTNWVSGPTAASTTP